MAKSKKVKITGLTIKLGSKEIVLSTEDAQKLYDALGELFDEKVIVTSTPAPYIYPCPHPTPWVWDYPKITWQSTGSSEKNNYTVYCSNSTGALTLDMEGGSAVSS